MPIYEYKCSDCGDVFEIIQSVKDTPLKKCPRCGGKVTKLVSAPAIQFKGNGWYITDYARKKTTPHSYKKSKPESKKTNKESKEKDGFPPQKTT
ncbi:MAG: zinc ribbon domain-containing protein [Candidatus Aminicenantes bacterium]|nr:zinc ribbon domain-containing protein [Candidatus Aminicenantes bacterium]